MMKDPNFLLAVLSVVWMITVGLFLYIIKAKDNSELNTKTALIEIKDLIHSISLNIVTIQSDLKNNVETTKDLNSKVDKHNELLRQLEKEHTILIIFRDDILRRVTLLEEKLK